MNITKITATHRGVCPHRGRGFCGKYRQRHLLFSARTVTRRRRLTCGDGAADRGSSHPGSVPWHRCSAALGPRVIGPVPRTYGHRLGIAIGMRTIVLMRMLETQVVARFGRGRSAEPAHLWASRVKDPDAAERISSERIRGPRDHRHHAEKDPPGVAERWT